MSRLSKDAIIAQINVEINACMRELDGRGAGLCGEAVQGDVARIRMLEEIYKSGRESTMLYYLKKLSRAELAIIKRTCLAVMECIKSDNSGKLPSNFNANLSKKVLDIYQEFAQQDEQAWNETPFGQRVDGKHVPTETSRVFTFMLSQALMSNEAFDKAFKFADVQQYIINHPENEEHFLIPLILKSMVDVGLIDD